MSWLSWRMSFDELNKLYYKFDELPKLDCTFDELDKLGMSSMSCICKFDELVKLKMSSMSWISCIVLIELILNLSNSSNLQSSLANSS